MTSVKKIALPFFVCCVAATIFLTSGCGPYKFADVSIDPEIKTVRINPIDNRARYVNPQLHPALTNRIQQKINNQTRLTQTNSDNAHLDIVAYISDYSVSTSGVSNSGPNNQRQASINRLTVTVHLVRTNTLKNQVEEYDVSRSFDFAASLSLEAAQTQLLDEMVRNLTDDVFNRLFSNW